MTEDLNAMEGASYDQRLTICKLEPSGTVEKFLCDRVASAIETFDAAVASNTFTVDPLMPTQEQVIEELYTALAQLRALQTHRRAK